MEQVKYVYENLDQIVASKLTPEEDSDLDKVLNEYKNEIDNKNRLFNEKNELYLLKVKELEEQKNMENEIMKMKTEYYFANELNKFENLDYNKKVHEKILELRNKFFKEETGFTIEEYEEKYNNKDN